MSAKLNKIASSLFDANPVSLTEKEIEIRTRYMDLYTQMLSKPWQTNDKLVQYMQSNYSISRSQTYLDIAAVKVILGDVKNAGKEFHRYAAIEMINAAMEILENPEASKFDLFKAEQKIKAAKVLGYITRLDKEDPDRIPWEDIIPQNFEITGDVSVLGKKKIPDLEARKAKLRKELFGEIQDVEVDE